MQLTPDATVDAPDEAVAWTHAVYDAVDDMDAGAFADFFAEGARLQWANRDPVVGPDAVEAFVSDFFESIAGIEHTFTGVWTAAEAAGDGSDVLTLEGRVTYTLPDDSTATVPAAVVVERRDGLATAFRIYVDTRPIAE